MHDLPQFLYKVISWDGWMKSQSQNCVALTSDDKAFIHLSTESQLERILLKYWSHVPRYAILRVDPHQLTGTLVYEANPGGTNKYYHLYEGSIPLSAVQEVKIMTQAYYGHPFK